MDITNNNFSAFSEQRYAGKVNFNTAAKSDFITNEAFKSLRSNILFCGKDIKTILVTSTHENEGKSTIATELSKSLSDIDKRTLLIDADMRKSVILRHNLKSQGISGLSELLSGQAELHEVLFETQIPHFNVIFSGRFPPNPVELLNSDAFKELIEFASANYDYIVVDTPPLAPVIDASVISTYCDGAVLVIANGKTRINEAHAAIEQLKKSNSKILGAVLNQTDSKGKFTGGYYKKSSYYYAESSNSSKRKK